MADIYEVIHPNEKFVDAPGGDDVLKTIVVKWTEQGDGSFIKESGVSTISEITLPTAIFNGQKTVATAGSAEALSSSQAIVAGVHVKALITNTGKAYVGNSGVSSSNGLELDPGEAVFIEIANLATVYVDVAVNGEGVSYIAT